TIKVGNDFNASPFEFINEDGQFDGISADYLGWFAKEHGFNLVTLKDTPWIEVLERAKQGELDILPGAVETPSRKQYLNFTKPYLEFPMVLMAREDASYVASLSKLGNKRVAIGQGWFTEELLTNNYPQIQIVSVYGLKEGLISVLEGKADYYFGNLAAINYILKKERLTGLKVVATTNEKMAITMGVNKDNPILFSILQKTLNVMPEDEKNRIYNKWVQLTVENANYDKYIFITSLIFGLLIAAIIWLYITNRARNKLQAYIDKVNELRLATVLDKHGVITWVSKRYCALTGYEPEELIGKPYILFKPDSITNEDYQKRFNHVRSGKVWEGEVEGRTKKGETFYVKATIIPEMKGGSVQRITVYREDLSDKKRIEALSIKDELTGLYNRRYFNDVIQKEIKRARRENMTLVFAMADLDLFKSLNDCYGHLQGDVALKSVGKILNEHFMRPEDLVFRLGGEEFGCLFFNDDEDSIKEYLTELKNKVQALGIHNKDSEFGVLTISMGAIIVPPSHKLTAEIIYKLADNLLYKAKASGRNQIEFDVFR
ncbi:MAG: diguanylate cyclase, partial [Pseudomonadota bacterium]|nr:diguanylate cyclase [Pseudomonadota bacterium]